MTEEPGSKKPKKPVTDDVSEKSTTLENEVKDLESKLQREKEKLARKEKELDAKKKARGEINRAAELFGAAFGKLKKGIEEVGVFYKDKVSVIAGKVKEEKKKEINERIKEVDRDIKDQEKKVKDSEDKLKEAEKDYNNAEKKYKGIQEDYNAAKRLQREIENKLREIDNTGKLIAEEEKKSNFAGMYFLTDVEEKEAGLGSLIKELGKLTGKLKSLAVEPGKKVGTEEAVEEYKKILEREWVDFYEAEAKIDLKQKKEDIRKAKKELEENQKDLAEVQQARRSKILEKLKEIKFKKEE